MESEDHQSNREETLFVAARALHEPKQRQAFLDAVCEGDSDLRERGGSTLGESETLLRRRC